MTDRRDPYDELARAIAAVVRKAVESGEGCCGTRTVSADSKGGGFRPVVIVCGCGDAKEGQEAT